MIIILTVVAATVDLTSKEWACFEFKLNPTEAAERPTSRS